MWFLHQLVSNSTKNSGYISEIPLYKIILTVTFFLLVEKKHSWKPFVSKDVTFDVFLCWQHIITCIYSAV